MFVKTTRLSRNRNIKGGYMADNKKGKRELIDTGRDKRFVRRDEEGRFDEEADVGRSLAQDRRQHAKRTVPSGQGDRGDQKRKSS
jgi:hypothetical protein